MVSQDEILGQLEALKKKNRRYLEAGDFREHLPAQLRVKQYRQSGNDKQRRLGNIFLKQSEAATGTSDVIARNREEYKQMVAQEKAIAKAQKALAKAKALKRPIVQGPDKTVNVPVPVKSPQPFNAGTIGGGGPGRPGMSMPSGGGNVTNGLSNVGVGNVQNYNWRGRNLQLNPSAADNFIGFLNALASTGYDINTIGSYSNRNQANGSGLKSLHAYGLAIDINAAANPYGSRLITDMPKGIGRLAAKYGLVWGGNWRNSKDAMHFSIPYGGRE